MIKHCEICKKDTDHEKGNFKVHAREDGCLFHEAETFDEKLSSMSNAFTQHVVDDQGGIATQASVGEFVKSKKDAFGSLFAQSIRAFKCSECGHLIKLSKLP